MSFLEIFQPGLKHLREERERQKLMVARPPAAGPPLGIDLDAGVAVIPASPPTGPEPVATSTPGPEPVATSTPGP